MDTMEIDERLSDKIAELRETIAQTKTIENTNTRSTKLYNLNKNLKLLQLIATPREKWTKEHETWLIQLTSSAQERESYEPIVCKAGDKIMDLLERYRTRKGIRAKLENYCAKNNLFINWNTCTIEEEKK